MSDVSSLLQAVRSHRPEVFAPSERVWCVWISEISVQKNVYHLGAKMKLMYECTYVGFKTFYVVWHADSTASYLPNWLSFRFLSFMAFLIPSIQVYFSLSRALFCFGIHFNAILGYLLSAILWTWPYHVSWFCSISFIGSSKKCDIVFNFTFSRSRREKSKATCVISVQVNRRTDWYRT